VEDRRIARAVGDVEPGEQERRLLASLDAADPAYEGFPDPPRARGSRRLQGGDPR